MANVDALISIMQKALNDIMVHVENGYILSLEEAQQLIALKREIDGLKYDDSRNEVLKGNGLKSIVDKWS